MQVALSYIPRWYWERIGKPDLSQVPGLIQTSYVDGTGYASVLSPGNDSIGWAAYGERQPDILQFTDRALRSSSRRRSTRPRVIGCPVASARWNTSIATSSAASCTRTLSVCLAK